MNVKVVSGLLIVVVCLTIVDVVLLFRLYSVISGGVVKGESRFINVNTSAGECEVTVTYTLPQYKLSPSRVIANASIMYRSYRQYLTEISYVIYQEVYLQISIYNGEADNMLVKKIVVDEKYEPQNYTPVVVKSGSVYRNTYLIIKTLYDDGVRVRWEPGTTHNILVFINIYGEDYVVSITSKSVEYRK